jgi:hypothetical protein
MHLFEERLREAAVSFDKFKELAAVFVLNA